MDFLIPNKWLIGAICSLYFFGLPMTRLAGETLGNFATLSASALATVLAWVWIDEKLPPSQCTDSRSRITKNLYRIIGLSIFIIPLILIHFTDHPTPKTQTTKDLSPEMPIRISGLVRSPYETGKQVGVEIKVRSNHPKELKLRGTYRLFAATNLDPLKASTLEEELWSVTMTHDERTFPEFKIPPSSKDATVFLDGPVLIQQQAEQLRDGKTAALYFMGVFIYTDLDAQPRRMEFCGFYKDDPRVMFACRKHSEALSALIKR